MSYISTKTYPYDIYQSVDSRLDQACNLVRSSHIETLRNNSPKREMIKDYSEIIDLEKKNMKKIMGNLIYGQQSTDIPSMMSQRSPQNNWMPNQYSIKKSEFATNPITSTLRQRTVSYQDSLKEYLKNNELENQIKELKGSIAKIEKEKDREKFMNSEPNYRGEIGKLNKEIVSLQGTIQKLNFQINDATLPTLPNENNLDFLPPPLLSQESKSVMQNYTEHELNKQFKEFLGNIYCLPAKFQKNFNKNFINKEILSDLLLNKEYPVLLLNIIQMFNEYIRDEAELAKEKLKLNPENINIDEKMEVPNWSGDFENKRIDFKNYFQHTVPTSNHITPLKHQNFFNPSKFFTQTLKKEREDEDMDRIPSKFPQTQEFDTKKSKQLNKSQENKKRGFFNPDDDRKATAENRFYNNRSSERFPLNDDLLKNIDILDIDETTHKKKNFIDKKKRKINIISNVTVKEN